MFLGTKYISVICPQNNDNNSNNNSNNNNNNNNSNNNNNNNNNNKTSWSWNTGSAFGGIANRLMAINAPLALAGNLPKHGVMIKILREEKPCGKAYLNINEVFY